MSLINKINDSREKLHLKTRDFGNQYLTPNKFYEEFEFGTGNLLTINLEEWAGTITGVVLPGILGYLIGSISGAENFEKILLTITPYIYFPLPICCIATGFGIDSLRKAEKSKSQIV